MSSATPSLGFSSFDELKNTLADWVSRIGDAELAARIPDFVYLAERRIERELDWPMNERLTGGSLTVGNPEILMSGGALAGFSYPVHMRVGSIETGNDLDVVAVGRLEDIRRSQPAGMPSAMALVGGASGMSIRMAPTPDSAYPWLLRFMEGMPKLGDDNQNTWLLLTGPDALLHGALLEMAPFVHDDARVPMWEGFFRDAVRSLKRIAVRQRTGGGPLRIRPDRWA